MRSEPYTPPPYLNARRTLLGTLLMAVGVPALASAQDSPADASAAPISAFERARVDRLLENRIACLGCHVIGGRGGAIGPSLEGLRERANADYVEQAIRNPDILGAETLMPMQRLRDSDVDRLVRYLLAAPTFAGAPPATPAPQAPPVVGDPEDGAALYGRHCSACHGPTGSGDGWNAPTLPVPPTSHADATLMSRRTDDALFDAIYAGAFVLDGSARMPPYGATLTTTQIDALVRYIRTLCGCEQPAWAAR